MSTPMATKIKAESGLTLEEARALLTYDPVTGKFFYNRDIFTGKPGRLFRKAGNEAGGLNGSGYVVICINYRHFRAHRLAWFMTHGVWPEKQLDHRDLDRSNNRIDNLRPATNGQNMTNTKTRAKSGFKGVIVPKHAPNCYVAQISGDSGTKYLGTFKTPEDAHAAYVKAAVERHGEFART